MGDFVKVFSNEIVPADLLLLHTSDPNGVCHIETSNLDGETNLKPRRAVSGVCVSVKNTFSLISLLSSLTFTLVHPVLPHLSLLGLTFNTHSKTKNIS